MKKQAHYNPQPLDNVIGCLRSSRTEESSARRLWNPIEGPDQNLTETSPYRMDSAAILTLSAGFRRLGDKCQVIPAALQHGDIRTRLVHSIGVAHVAKKIARILGLNEDLAEAIALCHDIGQAPFSHSSEIFFSGIIGRKFHHSTFGSVVLQRIDNNGRGHNLTHQVLGGIPAHSRGDGPLFASDGPPEWTAVMWGDKIEYVAADMEYFLAKGRDMSQYDHNLMRLYKWFGGTAVSMIDNCVNALCLETADKGYLSFGDSEAAKNFQRMFRILYTEVYHNLNEEQKVWKMLPRIYDRLKVAFPDIDPAVLMALSTERDLEKIHAPRYQRHWLDLAQQSFSPNLVRFLRKNPIDMTNAGLDW